MIILMITRKNQIARNDMDFKSIIAQDKIE